MAKLSKRAAAIAAKIDRNKFYPVAEALSLVKETATAKFDESIDVAVQLGIDPRKSDQLVRGSVVLPAPARSCVWPCSLRATRPKPPGSGCRHRRPEDLAESIKAGNIDFDIVIATPDTMRVVGAGSGAGSPRPDAQPQGRNGDFPMSSRREERQPVRFSTAPTRPASFTPPSVVLPLKSNNCRPTWLLWLTP